MFEVIFTDETTRQYLVFLSGIILSGMTAVFYFRVGILIKMFAGRGQEQR